MLPAALYGQLAAQTSAFNDPLMAALMSANPSALAVSAAAAAATNGYGANGSAGGASAAAQENGNSTTPTGSRDTTFTKIFVGGLPYHTTDQTLHDYFKQFGEIEEAVVITDRQTQKSRGYGFVTMKERADAEKACKDPNPIIDGRKANVNLAYLGAKPRNNVQLTDCCYGANNPNMNNNNNNNENYNNNLWCSRVLALSGGLAATLPLQQQLAAAALLPGRLGLSHQLYYPGAPAVSAAAAASPLLGQLSAAHQLGATNPQLAAALQMQQQLQAVSQAVQQQAAGIQPQQTAPQTAQQVALQIQQQQQQQAAIAAASQTNSSPYLNYATLQALAAQQQQSSAGAQQAQQSPGSVAEQLAAIQQQAALAAQIAANSSAASSNPLVYRKEKDKEKTRISPY